MAKKGLRPVSIEEARDLAAAAKKLQAGSAAARPRKIPARIIESFTRELANLLAGGVPLARSLALLRREASQPAAKQLWSDIHDDVVGGTALADALAKFPRNFSSVYIAMVRAGEAGGFLDVVLNQISDFRAREQDLIGKVKAAMVYPIILGILAIGVVIFLMTFFIPQFTSIFSSFGADLPAITQIVIGCSNILRRYFPIVLVVLIVGFVAWRRMVATPAGRRRVEQIMLATPYLGRVIAQFAIGAICADAGNACGGGCSPGRFAARCPRSHRQPDSGRHGQQSHRTGAARRAAFQKSGRQPQAFSTIGG